MLARQAPVRKLDLERSRNIHKTMGESILLHHSPSVSLSNLPRLSHLSPNQTSLLPIRSHLPDLSHSIRGNRFSARVVSDSKAPTLIFESSGGGDSEIQPDIGGGDGGSFSGGRGGGGGGGGGGSGGEGESSEEESSEGKKKMAMSMSQKFTLGYAALVGVGGLMGYMKSGSTKSLVAGGVSAAVLGYVYVALPTNPTLASAIGLGISAALLGVMGSRYKRSGKVFPAGVVSLMSLVMTAGYLHGITRGLSH